MMVAEIVAGAVFGSIALTADGWHMSTHAGALVISALAYRYARRHARNPRFAFGTGKLGDLAGFTSAVVLALVSLLIGYESLLRLASPVAIRFDEAIAVAVLGLAVNLVSAWLLQDNDHGHAHRHHDRHHDHQHQHEHDHAEGRHQHGHHRGPAPARARDHNLRSAYLHVLADAATSVLAIIGLLAGRAYGWIWMDPLMGMVGALVIAHWSWGLLRDTGAVLLDAVPDQELAETIRRRLEEGDDRVADLHLWRLGPGHNAAVITLVSDGPESPNHYKGLIADVPGLSHVTVEVQFCTHHSAAA